MIRVVLLGTGNVAQHLFTALSKSNTSQIVQVFGRDVNKLAFFKKEVATTHHIRNIVAAEVYIIAVSDEAIAKVSSFLENRSGIVAHTSGSTHMGVISQENRGVFYPLQTFTKGKQIDFKNIPICLEAHNQKSLNILKHLAKSISEKVVEMSTTERIQLHQAAIFVNNFTNHLYQIGEELCEQKNVSFDLLKPLILETADKIRFLSPFQAQTGPAKRKDVETMQRHLDALQNPIHKKIYQLISESIVKAHEEKL